MIFKLFNQLSLKIMLEIALKSPPTPSPVISVVHLVTTIAVVECE